MAFARYQSTDPQPRDTEVDTLRKILQQLGGNWDLGDTESTLLVKILVRLNGVQVFPTDTPAVTLQKILDQLT